VSVLFAYQMVEPYRKGDFKKPDRRRSARPEDRRVHPRFIFFADCELTDRSNGSHYEARVTEISLGGCFVDLIVPIPQGTDVDIRVRKDDQIFDTEGVATYIYPSMGIGIAFVNVSPASQQVLDSWIQSLTR
jgi:PilZ domain